ncbi:MAG: Eco57I restriction-modification methylase domain-containing protein [Clostridia bacterium]|nr:Eco57I restriction-modification methylase domain-containing protein [Clostridia bacterium]
MKFDFCIGNPPYQQESVGANANDTPVYHYFFDAATSVAEKVELITPARFLFDAGGTPKDWNEKMLNDEHLTVKSYEQDSGKVFSGTSITGGVVVTYRDAKKVFGAIDVFSPFEELNTIVQKVSSKSENDISEIVTNRGLYRYSDLAYQEEPDEMKKTADRRIAPSCFERMPRLFTDIKPNDGYDYVRVYGNEGNDRTYKWFRRDYVSPVENIDKYKVFISKADGAAGTIGKPVPARVSGRPVVIEPGVIGTETYITIGSSSSKDEIEAICKYIKTRFARTLLGVLKVTQNNAKPTWRKIPLQDFTSASDIDWSAPIKAIDQQLYKKYGLSDEEIRFIETHVKEMA